MYFFLFFKQKTAYEMRISDWSSDVCSSDLLRDPVDRALSHYHMERARHTEHWPLWPAMLLERWRLRGHHDDFADGSPLRHFSYRARGDYAAQLDALYRHFPPHQVLDRKSTRLNSRH